MKQGVFPAEMVAKVLGEKPAILLSEIRQEGRNSTLDE